MEIEGRLQQLYFLPTPFIIQSTYDFILPWESAEFHSNLNMALVSPCFYPAVSPGGSSSITSSIVILIASIMPKLTTTSIYNSFLAYPFVSLRAMSSRPDIVFWISGTGFKFRSSLPPVVTAKSLLYIFLSTFVVTPMSSQGGQIFWKIKRFCYPSTGGRIIAHNSFVCKPDTSRSGR